MKRMLKNTTIILVGVSLFLSCTNNPKTTSTTPSGLQKTDSLISNTEDTMVSIQKLWTEIDFQESGMIESMAYADTTNFIGQKIYPCAKCFLRPEAAQALSTANKIAAKKGLKLILFDCYRPTKYQQEMFDIVGDPKYVAEPKKGGSMHNKGLAVDIALADSLGQILDFGGDFDEFSERSHHAYTGLSALAHSNRILLKEIMTEAGFKPYPYEWWHYSYNNTNYDLDDFIWNCN